jgi:tryptophan synthase alpha chain
MSRLTATFDRLRASRAPGLVTFTTAGDPDADTSARILVALAGAGADVLEVGVRSPIPSPTVP